MIFFCKTILAFYSSPRNPDGVEISMPIIGIFDIIYIKNGFVKSAGTKG
jgi:hypothetical protein